VHNQFNLKVLLAMLRSVADVNKPPIYPINHADNHLVNQASKQAESKFVFHFSREFF
jgi:tRNA A37 threonylcarbamoyltransferase TsaD